MTFKKEMKSLQILNNCALIYHTRFNHDEKMPIGTYILSERNKSHKKISYFQNKWVYYILEQKLK